MNCRLYYGLLRSSSAPGSVLDVSVTLSDQKINNALGWGFEIQRWTEMWWWRRQDSAKMGVDLGDSSWILSLMRPSNKREQGGLRAFLAARASACTAAAFPSLLVGASIL